MKDKIDNPCLDRLVWLSILQGSACCGNPEPYTVGDGIGFYLTRG